MSTLAKVFIHTKIPEKQEASSLSYCFGRQTSKQQHSQQADAVYFKCRLKKLKEVFGIFWNKHTVKHGQSLK